MMHQRKEIPAAADIKMLSRKAHKRNSVCLPKMYIVELPSGNHQSYRSKKEEGSQASMHAQLFGYHIHSRDG